MITKEKIRTVYNLASVKAWVEKKRGRYNRHNDAALQLYGYDVLCYGDKYNNGLYAEELFDTLSVYGRRVEKRKRLQSENAQTANHGTEYLFQRKIRKKRFREN